MGAERNGHGRKVAEVTARMSAEEAIPRLFERHGGRLYGLALRLCGNHADAEDLVQEVFLRAYRAWGAFRGDADPGTWLYTIAARSCKARSRRKGGIDKRAPALSQLSPMASERMLDLAVVGRESEDTPARAVLQRESRGAVQAAILSLPEQLRVPLVLKDVLEMSLEDVGAALGLKPETVKTRVHRARLVLRAALVEGGRAFTVPAPEPVYAKRVCLDLLKAKLDAMDQGRHFPVGREVVCDRCRGVFAELDLAQDVCAQMGDGSVPESVRRTVLNAVEREGRGVRALRPRGRSAKTKVSGR